MNLMKLYKINTVGLQFNEEEQKKFAEATKDLVEKYLIHKT